LNAHQRQLAKWAETYPPTFADKVRARVGEIARLEGRDADAMRLYEQAIRSARDTILCRTRAWPMKWRRGSTRRAASTRSPPPSPEREVCYLRWGASGKVAQLDRLQSAGGAPEGNGPTATIGAPLQQVDVTTVVKASQTLSSEIVFPKLIER